MSLATPDFESFGPVASCVAIISQDMSRVPLRHIRTVPGQTPKVVTNKAPARIFRKPNRYQVKADWILYLMRSILSDGNSYNYAIRNDRFEVEEFYPLHPKIVHPYISPEGEIFYSVGGDPTSTLASMEPGAWIPARDMLHIRGATPKHPLMGESPLVAAVYPTIAGSEINKHNAAFFANMGRPSGVLRHPGRLDESAMERIKTRFKEVATAQQTGEVLVLAEGMDWSPLTMTAVDAAIAEMYKLTERQIIQIYRVPPFLAGDLDNGGTFANVEQLTRFYLMFGLGVWENLIEEWLARFFNLPPNESIRFDVEGSMLQNDLKTRMEAYSKGIQGGVLKIDEARDRENLPPVEYGDEIRVQQQLVPLRWGAETQPPSPDGSSASSGDSAQSDQSTETDSETDGARALRTYQSLKMMLSA